MFGASVRARENTRKNRSTRLYFLASVFGRCVGVRVGVSVNLVDGLIKILSVPYILQPDQAIIIFTQKSFIESKNNV